MPAAVSVRQWWKLFLTGRTKGVYLALISFIIYTILILYNRLDLFHFVLTEIGLLASVGVLVDLVSHLFNDAYKTDISKEEWIARFKKGRTHDAYGIVIQVIGSAFDIGQLHLLYILWIALILEFYLIFRSRFYH